ncbi:PAS domain-containing sensor histidine kinase [Aquabacter sp. L1I39]|uniref:PAS domain-containing sensor histidine kinase n=1 Tax=Aquabacter sp. L1I39 TaxID=2820278 RepID=UPI001AD99CF5|nr:PAS domain-containing sensor histidine kinase [Aquabacter sp. L1I39]QTL02608.1 PAS domain-containing sensor histidine kinase [Aquabacter sp. L1I39]
MNDPFARMLQMNDPVFAPLRREDLPSFVVAVPEGEVVAATPACSRLGLAPDAPLPAPAADAARRIAAQDGETTQQERIFLPLAPEPQLFSCRAILTPAGQFVMFADPRSLSTSAAGDAAAHPATPSAAPVAGEPAARPVRFTWDEDADGRLTQLSDTFRSAFPTSHWQGQAFTDLLGRLGFSGSEALSAAMAGRTSFSDVTLEGAAGRMRLGGVTLFTPDRTCAGIRGFGQLWLAQARSAAQVQAQTAPAALVPATPAPVAAATPAPDAAHSDNVVPLRGGNLTPRERTAFHEIARTLHDAIDSWQKTGETPPPEADDAPSQAPEATHSGEGEESVLDRLPLGVVVHQQGQLVRVNRTLLTWCGDSDMEAFEAAGGLSPRLSRPDATKPLSLRTIAGADLPVEVRVVSAAWGGRPALVHVVRRLDDAPSGDEALDTTALQRALDLIPLGIVLLARSGAIEESNETLVRYAGFGRADLRGEPFTTLFAPHSRGRAVMLLDEAALHAPSLPCTATLTVRGRKGADVEMVATLASVENDAQRYCLVLRPAGETEMATPPFAAEPLPRGSRADALEAPQARAAVDALARRMSHAIRTPLTSILGFVDAVRSSTFGPVGNARYSKHAEAAQMAGQHLLALLEDVEHLFPPAPVTEPERSDLVAVMGAALTHLDEVTKRRRILLRRDGPDDLTCTARKAPLEHVVRLLLEEALRATPVGGQVMVSLRREGDQALLRVRDAGAPLSEAEIAQALDALSAAPVSDRFSAAGRPFRLARLSALVRAEGGTLSLQRGTGGGLLVELSFPA